MSEVAVIVIYCLLNIYFVVFYVLLYFNRNSEIILNRLPVVLVFISCCSIIYSNFKLLFTPILFNTLVQTPCFVNTWIEILITPAWAWAYILRIAHLAIAYQISQAKLKFLQGEIVRYQELPLVLKIVFYFEQFRKNNLENLQKETDSSSTFEKPKKTTSKKQLSKTSLSILDPISVEGNILQQSPSLSFKISDPVGKSLEVEDETFRGKLKPKISKGTKRHPANELVPPSNNLPLEESPAPVLNSAREKDECSIESEESKESFAESPSSLEQIPKRDRMIVSLHVSGEANLNKSISMSTDRRIDKKRGANVEANRTARSASECNVSYIRGSRGSIASVGNASKETALKRSVTSHSRCSDLEMEPHHHLSMEKSPSKKSGLSLDSTEKVARKRSGSQFEAFLKTFNSAFSIPNDTKLASMLSDTDISNLRKVSINFQNFEQVSNYSFLPLKSMLKYLLWMLIISFIALIITHFATTEDNLSPIAYPVLEEELLICNQQPLILIPAFSFAIRVLFFLVSPYFLYLLKEVDDSLCIKRELQLYIIVSLPLQVLILGIWSFFVSISYPTMVAINRSKKQGKCTYTLEGFEQTLSDPELCQQFKQLALRQLQVEKIIFYEYYFEVLRLYSKSMNIPLHPTKLDEFLNIKKQTERELDPSLVLEVARKMKRIIKVFLAPESPYFLRLNPSLLKALKEKKHHHHPTSLLDCWSEVYFFLFSGPYREFVTNRTL